MGEPMKARGSLLLSSPGIILLTTFFVLPLTYIFYTGIFTPTFNFTHFSKFFELPIYTQVFWSTIGTAFIVACACIIVAYPAAYIITRQSASLRRTLLFLVVLPMWVSVLVRSFAWMILLGREGVVNKTLQALGITSTSVQLLYTSSAVYVSMVQILLPYAILVTCTTMLRMDSNLEKAGRIMGATPAKVFWKIYFPLTLEGALGGFLIVFLLSLGFFITPALVGGPTDAMIANLVAMEVENVNWGMASAIAIVLLVATLLMVGLFQLLIRRFVYSPNRSGLVA
jgi:putative spermidine/putrescine transport system permease protein